MGRIVARIQDERLDPGQTPSVTVVVAALNESEHIVRLVQSLGTQTCRPEEVIVVDDGSTDATGELARREGATVLRTRRQGPAAARNTGASAARGEILIFLDGDMSVAHTFVERLVAPMAATEVAGTFTKEMFVGNPENPWARCYAKIRRLPFPRVLDDSFPDRSSNFLAVRRHLFLAAGGYDDVGYGEDMTLAPKIRAQAVAAPGARCYHFNPSSLRETAENGRWIGRGHDIVEVAQPWRDNAPWAALRKGSADFRSGGSWHVFPARLAYHVSVLIGLADRRLRPGRHWK